MATIKVEQASIDELKAAIRFSSEQTSQAADLVANAISGISGMSFSAKYGLDSDLTGLKTRLNKQAQLLQTCGRTVDEAVNAFVQVDNSTGTAAGAAWEKTAYLSNPAVLAVMGLSLTMKVLLERLANINGTFTDGGSSANDISASDATTSNHSIPLYSAWVDDRRESDWPEGYAGSSGCAVASTASALSGLLGKAITPKQIMSYQGNSESMVWGNCQDDLGVKLSTVKDIGWTGVSLSDIDDALKRYQSDPDQYSAPIIGSSNPQHYVVVTGKNTDGSYSIIDSSGCGAQTYTYSPSTPQLSNDGFIGNLVQIIQYQKIS